jgi:hypothetical protein
MVLLRDYGTGQKYLSSDGRFAARLMVEEERDFTLRDAYSSLRIASFYQGIDAFTHCLPYKPSDAGCCARCVGDGVDPANKSLPAELAGKIMLVCEACGGLGWNAEPGALDRPLVRCNPGLLPERWTAA